MISIVENIKKKFNKYFSSRVKELEFFVRKEQLENNILNSDKLGVTKEKYCDHDIIVSLTTYGKRLYVVHRTIETLMEQTMKANRIILWLSNDLKDSSMPEMLNRLVLRGLEIRFCEDLRSYKKLIPTLELYPNEVIITVDDDVLYERTLLEHLIKGYQANPDMVIATRCRFITFGGNNKLAPYKDWKLVENTNHESILFMPTGVGGVLYPPRCFDSEVMNKDVFMSICKFGDDIWFKAMTLKRNVKTKKVYSFDPKGCEYLTDVSVQDMALFKNNLLGENMNDKQLYDVFSKYDIFSILR